MVIPTTRINFSNIVLIIALYVSFVRLVAMHKKKVTNSPFLVTLNNFVFPSFLPPFLPPYPLSYPRFPCISLSHPPFLASPFPSFLPPFLPSLFLRRRYKPLTFTTLCLGTLHNGHTVKVPDASIEV